MSEKPEKLPWTKLSLYEPVEEPSPLECRVDDVYWAVYNAFVELVPKAGQYTRAGRAVRHMVTRNAVERLWSGEVHRDPGRGV